MKWKLETGEGAELPMLTAQYGGVTIDRDGTIRVSAPDYDAEHTQLPVEDMRALIAAFDEWKARQ